MADTFWLTLTNIVLGALVILCVLVLITGTLCEMLSKLRRERTFEAELNHDMREMFPPVAAGGAVAHAGARGLFRKILEEACGAWRRVTGRR
jgi:hypothetical protein